MIRQSHRPKGKRLRSPTKNEATTAIPGEKPLRVSHVVEKKLFGNRSVSNSAWKLFLLDVNPVPAVQRAACSYPKPNATSLLPDLPEKSAICYPSDMRLFEYEGKDLLAENGYAVPRRIALAPLAELQFSEPCVLKAQVLTGNRKAAGLIHLCRTPEEFAAAQSALAQNLKTLGFSADTQTILQEELVPYTTEYYLAFRYDTRVRLPVLLFSAEGGSGIEERSETAHTEPVLQEFVINNPENPDFPTLSPTLTPDWISALFRVFLENDMTLLEINPLVEVNGALLFLDSKTELDDTAHFRHEEWATRFPPRTLFNREPTFNEQRAKEINALDHRGVAGASYFDFPGTIAILASGGGASTLAMDTLLATSLKPANYTEYSGNPTREKVAALAELVLQKPNLEGLWIVGGHANFTDIYETLMGVMDGIEKAELPPGFPIVVRRGGPKQEEAFAELRQRAASKNLVLHTFDSGTPIPDTAFVLESAVQEFRQHHESTTPQSL